MSKYVPYFTVGVSISLMMAGAYAAVGFASLTAPKTVWTANPITIKFSDNAGTGSASVRFKCAPAVTSPVTLKSDVSNPVKIILSVSQTSFTTCGPLFHPLTLTVHCLVASCAGIYTARVTVSQGYSTFPPSLAVTVVVT